MTRYLIFSRERYEDPLSLRGELQAADDDAAAQGARERVPDGCVELQLVPETAIRWIVGPSGEQPSSEEVARV
ncbi:MAG: hypothetical protein ABSG43_06455 [Solirubrobacteraceae bacterium]|jgi:hypothetical protein